MRINIHGNTGCNVCNLRFWYSLLALFPFFDGFHLIKVRFESRYSVLTDVLFCLLILVTGVPRHMFERHSEERERESKYNIANPALSSIIGGIATALRCVWEEVGIKLGWIHWYNQWYSQDFLNSWKKGSHDPPQGAQFLDSLTPSGIQKCIKVFTWASKGPVGCRGAHDTIYSTHIQLATLLIVINSRFLQGLDQGNCPPPMMTLLILLLSKCNFCFSNLLNSFSELVIKILQRGKNLLMVFASRDSETVWQYFLTLQNWANKLSL